VGLQRCTVGVVLFPYPGGRVCYSFGVDFLEGQSGNDRINAADGIRDVIDCGIGDADTAYVDSEDVVENCENVFRSLPDVPE